jgi:predicted dehydrogenase
VNGYGRVHVDSVLSGAAEHGVRLVAAIDPEAAACGRLAELRAAGAAIHGDLADFYRGGGAADLVVISAPIHLHVPLSELALANGSHVLCEKPLGATVQEAAGLLRAERDAGRFVAIGYQGSFARAVQELKRDILSGVLGRPRRLKTITLWPRAASYYARNGWAGALKTPGGEWVLDSPVNNATSHYLHNMLFLLGEREDACAVPVRVTAELYRANAISNYDTAALRVLTSGGAEILFYTTHAVARELGPLATYEFERGVVRYTHGVENRFTAVLESGEVRDYGAPDADRNGKLWDCVDAVRSGGRPVCGVAAASAQTLCMNGAQDSAGAITDFPSALVSRTAGDDPVTVVAGLDALMIQAFGANVLLAELGGVEWARGGRPLDVTAYASFPGGRGNCRAGRAGGLRI